MIRRIIHTTVVGAALVVAALVVPTVASAQVRHIQTPNANIATAVWVGDMLYVSGQLPSPVTAADRATNTPAVWGNTQQQAENTFQKIQALLKEQGLDMGNVVMVRVFMVADPATSRLEFAGMNAAYNTFFGTPAQPNKPARSTVQVAALVTAGALLEVEVQAARPR